MSAVRGRRVRLWRFESAAQRLDRPAPQAPQEILDDLGDDAPRRVLRRLGDGGAQGHQVGEQVDVWLERLQEVRLHQQRLEVQALEGVLLDDLDDACRKELADVAQPARHARRRGAEPAFARARLRVVERPEGGGEAAVLVRKTMLVVLRPHGEAPPPHPLGVAHGAASSPRIFAQQGKGCREGGLILRVARPGGRPSRCVKLEAAIGDEIHQPLARGAIEPGEGPPQQRQNLHEPLRV